MYAEQFCRSLWNQILAAFSAYEGCNYLPKISSDDNKQV